MMIGRWSRDDRDHHTTIFQLNNKIEMGKVIFDMGIDSVRGILMGSDPFYIRRYPDKDGGVMHIVQARPNRSNHIASEAEKANRVAFGVLFGQERHREFIARTMKGQLEIEFVENGKD